MSCFHSSLPPSPSCSPSYPLSSSSSISLLVRPRSLLFLGRNANSKRRIRAPTATSRGGNSQELQDSAKRRALILLGVSIVPFLQHRDGAALEASVSGEVIQERLAENENGEQALESKTPSNPFLSLLNAIGILSSGVIGALYALAQKEKNTTEATIESLNDQLKQKDAVIISLGKDFESKILYEQEEQNKQLSKAKEEKLSLLNQLESANSTIKALRGELQVHQWRIAELEVQLSGLQAKSAEIVEAKRVLGEEIKEKKHLIAVLEERMILLGSEIKEKEEAISSLSTSLTEKDLDLKNLDLTFKQTKDELAHTNLEMDTLKGEALKLQKELKVKNSMVDELDARISALLGEIADDKRLYDALENKYNDLKFSSEQKAGSDAKLLGEKEDDLRQLEEKYHLALTEANKSQALVSVLTEDRDSLKKSLDVEAKNVNNLKQDLLTVKESLGASRNEVSELANQLKQSQDVCWSLKADLSKAVIEFSEMKEFYRRSLEEAKSDAESVSGELSAAKGVIKQNKDDLEAMSAKLASLSESRSSLQKELVDAYKVAETSTREIKDEKHKVASLNKELQALERQMSKEWEARKRLEADLDESTKSLDEVNNNYLKLSKELEMVNSQVYSLEEERDFLKKALEDQKKVSREARENLEDAHSLVMKLGSERERLDLHGRKLEEQLASAKSEISRLRNELSSLSTFSSIQPQPKEEPDVVTAPAASAKRTPRRRRLGSE